MTGCMINMVRSLPSLKLYILSLILKGYSEIFLILLFLLAERSVGSKIILIMISYSSSVLHSKSKFFKKSFCRSDKPYIGVRKSFIVLIMRMLFLGYNSCYSARLPPIDVDLMAEFL